MDVVKLMDFSKSPDGLIPAITQDAKTLEVLMVAYVNEEALSMSLKLGEAVYYSRSRQEIWHKGATSGNTQKIVDILVDCDEDTIIYLVEQRGGGACHTGKRSCFFRRLSQTGLEEIE